MLEFSTGVLNAQMPDVLTNGAVKMALEGSRHIHWMHVDQLSNFGQRESLCKTLVQDLTQLAKPCRPASPALVSTPQCLRDYFEYQAFDCNARGEIRGSKLTVEPEREVRAGAPVEFSRAIQDNRVFPHFAKPGPRKLDIE